MLIGITKSVLLVLISGCNDNINTAAEIPTGTTIQAAINYIGDADYYQFEVPVESIININVQNVTNTIGLSTVLYDAPNELSNIASWNVGLNGSNVNRYYKICIPGTYYLKLSDINNDSWNSQLYDMTINIDSTDIYEYGGCNDTEATAYSLEVCSDTLFAAINLQGDQDYFSFDAPSNINIQIEATEIPSNIDMRLELISSTGIILDSDAGNNGSNVGINYLTSQEDTYILRFYHNNNNANNADLYQIAINLIPEFNLAPELENLCIDGSSIELSGGSPEGGYYTGNGVDSLLSVFDPIVSGVGEHTITFTYENPNTACVSETSTVITVHELPDVNLELLVDTIVLNASPLLLSGGSPSGGNYEGMGVDVETGLFDPSIGVGIYTISYTYIDDFGCTNTVEDLIEVVEPTSTYDLFSNSSISIGANPFYNELQINFNSPVNDNVEISIYNMNGVKIYYEQQYQIENTTINIQEYPSGIYFLKIKFEQKDYIAKIIKR